MCTAATYKTRDFYFGRTLDYEFSYGDQITPCFHCPKAMREHAGLFLDAEHPPQQAPQTPGRLPDHDLHAHYLPSFKHMIPQAISRNATRNISAPTGKMAAIRIPSPRPRAHTPMTAPQFPRLMALSLLCLSICRKAPSCAGRKSTVQ